MAFDKFDPLKISSDIPHDEGTIIRRQKRNIHSILHSYVGWYDPFAELIQNALDSVDKRKSNSSVEYSRRVRIIVDLQKNRLTVSDNGTGLDETAFHRFLAPNESFKDYDSRGSKGVGATYIAYGFNYIRVDTKTKTFSASGVMEGARNWLHDKAASENPQVHSVDEPHTDPVFKDFDTGVSITVVFDEKSKPSSLSWPSLNNAKAWYIALSIKTGLGAIYAESDICVEVVCIDNAGCESFFGSEKIAYMQPYEHLEKVKEVSFINKKYNENIEKFGAGSPIPGVISNLEAVYLDWDAKDLCEKVPKLSDSEKQMILDHSCSVRASYMYTAEIWKRLANKIGYRNTANLYAPGIQLAADNMPQGEVIQVPLQRYTGRQNQVHLLVHFSDCVVDLGRKGFDKDFVDLAKSISTHIVQDVFSKVRNCLKTDDLKKTGLLEKQKVSGWKQQLIEHEANSPLFLKNENFFNPINEVAVTAEPSREQDVIALFNQLLAGGVVRGIRVVGTNEQMTYDGAFRICIGPEYEKHEFNQNINPLGIPAAHRSEFEENFPSGFKSNDLMILEYKYSVDGLIHDLETGDKKAAEIDLIVAWEMGYDYERLFRVQSLLSNEGRSDRDYHGITHKLYDEHGRHVMDAVILKDLVSYLNDPTGELENQESLYSH